MEHVNDQMLQARSEGILLAELPDGVLVYDRERDRGHSLNEAASFVWRHCDGTTSVAELSALMTEKLDLPPDEAIVWSALDQLRRAHLLKGPVLLPSDAASFTRRELLRKMRLAGALALAMPLVDSILVPAVASHGSHQPKGNNGVGNGVDPQPPGNPPPNDLPGTGPGNPGNQGGTPGNGNGNGGNGNGNGGNGNGNGNNGG